VNDLLLCLKHVGVHSTADAGELVLLGHERTIPIVHESLVLNIRSSSRDVDVAMEH
jgi:hypothetical protein